MLLSSNRKQKDSCGRSMVLKEQIRQINCIGALHFAHCEKSNSNPPHFLQDSSGNFIPQAVNGMLTIFTDLL